VTLAQNGVLELTEEELNILADLLMLGTGEAPGQFLEGNRYKRVSEASFKTRRQRQIR
jgi:hypothetical protein